MILIDTNVLSELWRPHPDATVLAWMDEQIVETLYLSVITIAELRFGIACLPAGKRRSLYHERIEREVLPAFKGRVLPFDLEASQAFAMLMARAKAGGKAIGKADGYIAATAVAHKPAVATRDVAPFQAAGLSVLNPWQP